MTQPEPLLLRAKQVAQLLSIHPNTVWNRVRAGELPAPIKWHGVSVWRRQDIENFVDRLADHLADQTNTKTKKANKTRGILAVDGAGGGT